MSQKEVYGTRDRTYSAWHREESTERYVTWWKAHFLAMIDMDATPYVEYDDGTKEPLALIETAIDINQENKPSTVTKKLAQMADLPAFCVLYTIDTDNKNPADPTYQDISQFRIKQLHPHEDFSWRICSPGEYAEFLVKLRKSGTSRN